MVQDEHSRPKDRPQDAGASYTVTITTRNAANATLYGPTTTNAYNIKLIGTADLGDSAVTTPKIVDGSVMSAKLAFGVDPTQKCNPRCKENGYQ
jgi:hypothetical protein